MCACCPHAPHVDLLGCRHRFIEVSKERNIFHRWHVRKKHLKPCFECKCTTQKEYHSQIPPTICFNLKKINALKSRKKVHVENCSLH